MKRSIVLIKGILFLSLFLLMGPALEAYADQIDPKAQLQSWLQNKSGRDLDQCVSSSSTQAQYFFMIHSTVDYPTLVATQNTMLLTCLYGLDVVNSTLCLGQAPGTCQPVTLLIPTSAQIQAANLPPSPTTLDSTIY